MKPRLLFLLLLGLAGCETTTTHHYTDDDGEDVTETQKSSFSTGDALNIGAAIGQAVIGARSGHPVGVR